MDHLPARLHRARLARGLTQAKLASRAELSDGGAVSRYERGDVAPSAESLAKLGAALDVSLDWLCGDGDDAVPAALRGRSIVEGDDADTDVDPAPKGAAA